MPWLAEPHDEDHAARHADGGADEIDAADLGSGAATDGQVLTADGAGAAAWEDPTGGGGAGGAAYAETIGDGAATSYQVTHSLGTQDLVVQLWDLTGAEPIEATGDASQIEVDDTNNITVTFGSAPATDSYRVVVLGSGGSSGASGGLAVIDETVLASSAGSIDWGSIPSTYRHLVIELQARGDTATNPSFVRMRFNNDSSAKYHTQRLFANNTTVSASVDMSATSVNLGRLLMTAHPSGHATNTSVRIPNYAGSTFYKGATFSVGYFTGTGAANAVAEAHSALWTDASAINRVTLFPSAGNFIAGTTATLYGLATA